MPHLHSQPIFTFTFYIFQMSLCMGLTLETGIDNDMKMLYFFDTHLWFTNGFENSAINLKFAYHANVL